MIVNNNLPSATQQVESEEGSVYAVYKPYPCLEKIESPVSIDPQLKTDEKDDNSNKQEQQEESTIIEVKESI